MMMNNNKTMTIPTMKNLLPQMGHRLLLALVLMTAMFSDAVAGEFSAEICASDFSKNAQISTLTFQKDGKELGVIELFTGGFSRTGDNFKLSAGKHMKVTAASGYVIKEIYAYDQIKGTTFDLMPNVSGYKEQCKNYFSGSGDGFGVFLNSNGSAMAEIFVRANVTTDMEFRWIKLVVQKMNPVERTNSSMIPTILVSCKHTENFEMFGLPSDYHGQVAYSSDNPSIATVNNGVIYGHKSGNTTVYAYFPAYGDYAPKCLEVDIYVAKLTFSPKFDQSSVEWLSSNNMVNPLADLPADYDGKIVYRIEQSNHGCVDIADQNTGRLTANQMVYFSDVCRVTAVFSESDYYHDTTCGYTATVYATDSEGYVKIMNSDDFESCRNLELMQDQKLRLYADVVISGQDTEWSNLFSGELDGAGHTIIFEELSVTNAYFNQVQDAKFRNLNLKGKVSIVNTSYGNAGAGFINVVAGTDTEMTHCQFDLDIYLKTASAQYCAAVVGYVPSGQQFVMSDCRVNSTINVLNRSDICSYAAFVGQSGGMSSISYCFYRGEVTGLSQQFDLPPAKGDYKIRNCYVSDKLALPDSRLSSGEVAYQLQGGREEMVWGQTLAPLDGTEVAVDSAPVLTTDADKRVYRLTPAVAPDEALVYSNVQEPMLPLSVSSAGYATYYNSFAMRLPSAVKAYTVSSISDGHLNLSEIADGVVPAMTAVLLESTGGTSFTGRMQMLPTDSRQPIAGADNLLRGSDVATKTHAANGICDESATADDDGTLYYKFAYGRSGTASASLLGFWWGAAQGAPFQSAAHKAWLAVPSLLVPNHVQGFAITDGSTPTGIDRPTTQTAQAPIYTLDGVRLSGQPVRRGVYIVNGKKVMKGK